MANPNPLTLQQLQALLLQNLGTLRPVDLEQVLDALNRRYSDRSQTLSTITATFN